MTTQAQAFPPNSLAPWAEIVPTARALTTDDLARLPDDDGYHYELVEGVLVRMPQSSFGASNIAARLLIRLGAFVEDHHLGQVTGEAGGYRIDQDHPKQTELAPDVAFVRAERVPPRTDPDYYRRAPQLAPDLAVEVASSNQSRPAMGTKARLYLTFGTRLVWVIFPRWRQVDVWRAGAARPITLKVGDLLDGEDVIPGFTYPVASLFT